MKISHLAQGINIEGVDLSNLDLRNINFKCANLRYCNLSNCDLSNCVFERADMYHANLDVSMLVSFTVMMILFFSITF